MTDEHFLDFLPENPGAVVYGWREIREKIQKAAEHATTEQQRVALLAAHKAVMDIAENAGVHPDDLEMFRKARREDYNLLLARECFIGDHCCTETAYYVTRREIAAGRMAANDQFAVDIERAIAQPHYTRAQLLEMERRKHSPKPTGIVGRLGEWLRRS